MKTVPYEDLANVPAERPPTFPVGDPLFVTPRISWPTVGLFAGGLAVWALAIVGAESGWWGLTVTIPVQMFASFMLFTVLHDGVHGTFLNAHPRLNEVLTNVAAVFVSPLLSSAGYRLSHFEHHKFTNDPEKDPDFGILAKSAWIRPFYWMTADLVHIPQMIRDWGHIPAKTRRDMSIMMAISIAFYASSWILGFGWEATIYWLVPTRLNFTWLAFAFGYLPHGPQRHVRQSHNPFAATNVRKGGEPLMRFLFLYQNYHAIHHLFPGVPFYRYYAIWNARRDEFQAKGMQQVPWWRFLPETAD